MKADQHRLSFQSEGWFRKQLLKSHRSNRVPDWIGNKQLDIRKKTSILDGIIDLNKFQLMELGKELCKVKRNQRPGIDRKLLRLVIGGLDLFFENRELIEFSSKFLQSKYYPKGQFVVKQGEFFSNLYFLLEGRCQIISSVSTMTVSGEAVFGENQLFQEQKSKATIKCKTDCQFFILKSEDFKAQKERAQNLSSKSILKVLKKNHMFRAFDPIQLEKLSQHSEIITLKEKGDLIKQGRKHNYFYIIGEGEFTATQIVNNKQKKLHKLEKFDIINIEGLLDKLPVLNIKSNSEKTELYRFSLAPFLAVMKSYPKILKEGILSQIALYKSMSINKGRSFSQDKGLHEKYFNFNTFLSEINQSPGESIFKQACSEVLRTKVNLFSKPRNLFGSEGKRSGSVRSKDDSLPNCNYLYNNTNIYKNTNSSNEFMINAFKQKLDTSTVMQLDVQNKLYQQPPRFFKKSQDKQKLMNTVRMGNTMTSFNCSHQHNKSQIMTRRARTANSPNKKQDTQILLKRIQMSSCRKRRNRTKIMFDPQQILDFNQDPTQQNEQLIIIE